MYLTRLKHIQHLEARRLLLLISALCLLIAMAYGHTDSIKMQSRLCIFLLLMTVSYHVHVSHAGHKCIHRLLASMHEHVKAAVYTV